MLDRHAVILNILQGLGSTNHIAQGAPAAAEGARCGNVHILPQWPYEFHKLVRLPDLALRLKAAIRAVSESDSTLRKVFLLTAQVTETDYLWRGQVMRSFEELSTAICADLEAKVCVAISQCIASTYSSCSNCMTYAS